METSLTNNQLKPKDQVIQYIRHALQTGELVPNTKLPSERNLSEKFNISRSSVREALKTLENYGIIKTLPQSGSVIIGLDIQALDGLLSDVIKLDAADFASLVEMRVILEVNSARLCALRRDVNDINNIRKALDIYTEICNKPDATTAERSNADFAYHRAIAAGSKNSALSSMLIFITPDIMTMYRAEHICDNDSVSTATFAAHNLIFQHILNQDVEMAANEMRKHLSEVVTYAKSLRK